MKTGVGGQGWGLGVRSGGGGVGEGGGVERWLDGKGLSGYGGD